MARLLYTEIMRSGSAFIVGICALGFAGAAFALSADPARDYPCVYTYQPEFLKNLGITPEDWKKECEKGKTPAAILIRSGENKRMRSARSAVGESIPQIAAQLDPYTLYPAPTYDPSGPCDSDESADASPIGVLDRKVECTVDRWQDGGNKRAFKRMFDLVGYRREGEATKKINTGLLGSFANAMAASPSARGLLHDFYSDIEEIDRKRDSQPMSLTDEAGLGRNADLKPGWLWEKAMAAAGGNPNLAMRLVGYCGHEGGAFVTPYAPSHEESQKFYAKWMTGQARKIAELDSELSALKTTSREWRAVNDYKNQLQAELNTTNLSKFMETDYDRAPCPTRTVSSMFIAKSFGPDIPEILKWWVMFNRAPADRPVFDHASDDAPKGLEAKTYHVFAGAHLACEMIAAGGSKILAVAAQGALAWAYRTNSINPEWRELAAASQMYSENDASAHEDAFYLMQQWGYGGVKFFGTEIPMSNIRFGWPLQSILKLKPAGWSDRRLAAAKKEMNSILVGWDWTVAQHVVGALFAAQVCEPDPAYKNNRP